MNKRQIQANFIQLKLRRKDQDDQKSKDLQYVSEKQNSPPLSSLAKDEPFQDKKSKIKYRKSSKRFLSQLLTRKSSMNNVATPKSKKNIGINRNLLQVQLRKKLDPLKLKLKLKLKSKLNSKFKLNSSQNSNLITKSYLHQNMKNQTIPDSKVNFNLKLNSSLNSNSISNSNVNSKKANLRMKNNLEKMQNKSEKIQNLNTNQNKNRFTKENNNNHFDHEYKNHSSTKSNIINNNKNKNNSSYENQYLDSKRSSADYVNLRDTYYKVKKISDEYSEQLKRFETINNDLVSTKTIEYDENRENRENQENPNIDYNLLTMPKKNEKNEIEKSVLEKKLELSENINKKLYSIIKKKEFEIERNKYKSTNCSKANSLNNINLNLDVDLN